jgi:pyrrolidone-carboxylate peptidase
MQSDSILITAFRPFDGRTVNGAQTIAESLQSEIIAAKQVQICLLRVCWQSVDAFVKHTLAAVQHPLVIALGEADRPRVCVETQAHGNCDGADVLGQSPPASEVDAPIVTSRLAFSSAWFDAHQADVVQSVDAGNYLCNRLLYLGLNHSQHRFGFVHVPVQGGTRCDDYLNLYREPIITLAANNLSS